MTSTCGVRTIVIVKGLLSILTNKMSKDHLVLFFCAKMSSLRCNNNPVARGFQCFNSILSCPSTKFYFIKLGPFMFIDVAFLLY